MQQANDLQNIKKQQRCFNSAQLPKEMMKSLQASLMLNLCLCSGAVWTFIVLVANFLLLLIKEKINK